MVVIRKAQIEVFEQASVHHFEQGLLDHLEKFFPQDYAFLGEEQVLHIIRYGSERAASYGIDSERGLYLFIDLMFMLGSHFDQDPQLPWATQILTDEHVLDGNARAEQLYDRAMDYLDRVMGPENEHLQRALLKFQSQPFGNLPGMAGQSFGERLMLQLHALFPQKYKAVGDAAMRAVIRNGYVAARQYRLQSEQGISVYIGLMFLLGSGFDSDPQFPWASTILTDRSLTDADKKTEALYARALSYLETSTA